MKIDRIALIGYLILCVVAIFANFFELYGLKLFSKSMLIPVLFFYYIGNVEKLDFLSIAYLFFNFVGDSIGIFDFKDEIQYLIIPFFICNVLLIFIMLKRIERFRVTIFNLISMLIVSLFLGYLWYTIVDIFKFTGGLQVKVAIYGIALFLISFLAAYKIINKVNTSNLYLLLCASFVLISDVFYILYNFQAKLLIFDSIHFSCQIFSYLFFVNFIINREKLSLIINKQS
jgi:hypothetical protein